MEHSLKLIPLFGESSGNKEVIELASGGDTEVTLGRLRLSNMTDKRCSREHLKLALDSKACELIITQLGSNPAGITHHGDTHVLAKHQVKRIPLDLSEHSDKLCVIHLVNRDHLYGFDVVVKTTTAVKASNKLSDEKPATKKRASSTLDSFVVKKSKMADKSAGVKVKDNQNGTVTGDWSEVASQVFLFSSDQVTSSSKIAGFDMDGTLITTESGAKWPKSKDDWKFLFPNVPSKLRSLHSEGFKLVIMTNQGGIANGTVKAQDIKDKIRNIINKVNVPMQAVIAGCKRGMFRKPLPGMWKEVVDNHNGNVHVELKDCVYVGDAAGRPANWKPGKKKDFSASDRLFALNCGVPFSTPEAFFNGEKEGSYSMPEFDPKQALKNNTLLDPVSADITHPTQEVIIMVGFPGSGKSYFTTKYLGSYERVNRDTLGSWQKCVSRCEEALKSGKSVVVDNTNPDKETRARYTQVASKHKVPVRCFYMTTTYKHARHNEVYRQLTDSKHKSINEMVVNAYKSKFCEPDVSEGFTEIVKVNIVPEFKDEQQRQLYSLHLIDK